MKLYLKEKIMVNLYYLTIFFFGCFTIYLLFEIKRKNPNKNIEITFLDLEIFYFLFWALTYLFCKIFKNLY